MTALRSSAFVAVAALSFLGLSAPAAFAEETVCRGKLGRVTVDNLVVPENATCRLTGTRVKGSIEVEDGATLVAARVVVIGNVKGDGAKSVTVKNQSRIGGSVEVKDGGTASVASSEVDGNIQLKSNSARLTVIDNIVGADVQAFENSGGVEISDNRIDGNLQCKSNRPAPTGGDNIVQGNKEDQCRRL